MKVRLTPANVTAFFLFMLLMGEAHEIAHFIVGKIICGCWPVSRDFNAWDICECDLGYWATAAGPIFSMSLAWIGMFLLNNPDSAKKSLGFILIWSNVPQARIMTVLMGGGDEGVVLRNLTEGTMLESNFRLLAIAVVFVMALPPIIKSFRSVDNKRGWLYNLGFMIVPLVVVMLYVFVLLNGLLKNGFLSDVWIMGTPVFITLHTVLVFAVLMIFFRKQLFTLAVRSEAKLVTASPN
jgi:hypothetical protein